MGEVEHRLAELGSAIAGADAPDREAIAEARKRVLEGTAPRRRPRMAPVAGLAAAAALLLAVGAWIAWPSAEPVLQHTVDERPGTPGRWLAANDAPVSVAFDDGTAIVLAPQARARVEHVDAHGAQIRLEAGRLDVDVVHRAEASWEVSAGPYVVHVVGTAFEVRWDAGTEQLEVRMREGVVRVRGGALEQAHTVRAGWTLRAAPDHVSVSRSQPPTPSVSGAPEAAPTEPVPAETDEPVVDRTPSPTPEPPLTNDELYARADELRFAGRRADAERVLQRLRARGERGRTAFLLGRLSVERQRRNDARRWFAAYLREEPNGALAESALGRLMEIEEQLDPEAARRSATTYLARYPRGAHAPLARRLSASR